MLIYEAMKSQLKHIVLLGMGHTNLEIARRWQQEPIPQTKLTCISNFRFSTYSGMLPSAVAGYINKNEIDIDYLNLQNRNDICMNFDEVVGLDAPSSLIHIKNSNPIKYDVLSIGIGSITKPICDFKNKYFLNIKPIQTFIPRLTKTAGELQKTDNYEPTIAVLGGGVAGVEIALAVDRWMASNNTFQHYNVKIIDKSDKLTPKLKLRTQKKVSQIVSKRKIAFYPKREVTSYESGLINTSNSEKIEADIVISAIGAYPPALISELNIPLAKDGFIETKQTLRSVSGLPIFAVGDCGSIQNMNVPKAGVYAVRQGPILWKNIIATLNNTELANFVPQSDYLKLINTSDGKAILEYKMFTIYSKFCYWLKNYIDRKFLSQFKDL